MKEDVRVLKDALEKPKHKKEHIKKASNRYFVETFRNFELKPNLSSKLLRAWSSQIDAIKPVFFVKMCDHYTQLDRPCLTSPQTVGAVFCSLCVWTGNWKKSLFVTQTAFGVEEPSWNSGCPEKPVAVLG